MIDYDTASVVFAYPKAETSSRALFYWKGDIVGHYEPSGKRINYIGVVVGLDSGVVRVRFWFPYFGLWKTSVVVSPDRLVRLGRVVE